MAESTPERVLASGHLRDGHAARVILGPSASPALREEVLQLLQASFGVDWPGLDTQVSPAEHLAWKLQGPFPDEPTYLSVVEIDGRIVAMSTALRERALAAGVRLDLAGGGDACTHPEYQGRGLYRQRRDFEADTIEHWFAGSLTTAGDPRVLHDRVRRNEAIAGENDPLVLVRVLHPIRYARARRRDGSRWPWPLAAGAFSIARLLASVQRIRPAPRPQSNSRIVEVERFDERFDELFDDCAAPFEFIKVRSADYLNWRYADPRAGQYTVLAAEDEERLLGYVALKLDPDRSYVMDLMARPGRPDVASSLLAAAMRCFAEAGSAAAVCWLPDRHPYRGVLRRLGFLDAHQPTGIAISSYRNPDADQLAFLRQRRAAVHIMLGDSDNA